MKMAWGLIQQTATFCKSLVMKVINTESKREGKRSLRLCTSMRRAEGGA